MYTARFTIRPTVVAIIAACAALISPSSKAFIPEPQVSEIGVIRADFRNQWFVQPPSDPNQPSYDATTFYSGEVNTPGTTCGGGGVCLSTAAFGQPFASTVPYPDFQSDMRDRAASLLYYTADGTTGGQNCVDDFGAGVYCKENASFRYRDLIYGPDTCSNPAQGVCAGDATVTCTVDNDCTGGIGPCNVCEVDKIVNLVAARERPMSDFYGTDERCRSLDAELVLRDAIKYDPLDTVLRRALLDLLYDRMVAEIALAKEKLVEASRARLGIEAVPPGTFVLDNEITLYEETIEDPAAPVPCPESGIIPPPGGLKASVRGYFELLRDGLGVSTSSITGSSPAPRFGYYIFEQEVPNRSLFASTYLDNDVPTPVVGNCVADPVVICASDDECAVGDTCDIPVDPPMLFFGYKDLVGIYDTMREYADVTSELAKLYLMRGNPTDEANIISKVTEAHRQILLDGQVLLSVFPESALPPIGDASGVAESVAAWQATMGQLSATLALLDGGSNILGFADDFMVFTASCAGVTESFDAYDTLYDCIQTQPSGPLAVARQELAQVRASYDTYRGYSDQLQNQFVGQTDQYDVRLTQIVGVSPITGDPAEYATPEDNIGSEVFLQLQSIEAACVTRIERNDVRLTNLFEQIQIEIDRRGAEKDIQNAISGVVITYGEQQADLTREIAKIQAKQAIANNLAAAIGSISGDPKQFFGSLGATAYAVNAGVQAELERRKGELQASKEKLAAKERSEILDLQNDLLEVEHQTKIKTWMLSAAEIEIDTDEAVILCAQELARLEALRNEKIDLERRLARSAQLQIARYYADPIHRLRFQSDALSANVSFAEAQRWVFFVARALEYKWNKAFAHPAGSPTFFLSTVYRMRNADELDDLVNAMFAFDFAQSVNNQNAPIGTVFSLREDHFGYKNFIDGKKQFYPDPETGDQLTAVQAFRESLNDSLSGPGGVLTLEFSTAKDLQNGFFQGPFFDPVTGQLISQGSWLDKIIWVQVAVEGDATGEPVIPGFLTYGGTAFVRNETIGQQDPMEPDEITGELTAYSTRHWKLIDGVWSASDDIQVSAQIRKFGENDVFPPEAEQILELQSRSVAATGWKLQIPTEQQDGNPWIDLSKVTDIKLNIFHQDVNR